MSAIEPFCRQLGIDPNLLSKEENYLLELDLLIRICEELKEFFREQYPDYFTTEKENGMVEAKLLYLIVHDILSTKEYTLEGIARYTDKHKDVIEEVILGTNNDPSATLFRKVIELHRAIRSDLYNCIIKKITGQYLTTTQRTVNSLTQKNKEINIKKFKNITEVS